MSSLKIILLAAGKGERMKSPYAKVLHPLCGHPVMSYPLKLAQRLSPEEIVVVVGHQREEVKEAFKGEPVLWAVQEEQKGTAHAVLIGLGELTNKEGLLCILYGDVPLLKEETLRTMLEVQKNEKADLIFLTADFEEPKGYGRVIRDAKGQPQKVVEEKEATEEIRKIKEVNTGIYLASLELLEKHLKSVEKSIVKGEYYLTDLIEVMIKEKRKVIGLKMGDVSEMMGVNSQLELYLATEIMQEQIRHRWMNEGVTLINPSSIHIEADVLLSSGVILHPGVILTGKTTIESEAEILPYSMIEDSKVEAQAKIGPFAHIRPGSIIGRKAHVGNFVELKKTSLGEGAKANHLTYLGDATVGARVNVGAGTITCNYDGKNKYPTIIEEGAFIGSDTQLVAPVRVGKGAYVGAGTTVVDDVPDEALAISRVDQKNIEGWAKKKN